MTVGMGARPTTKLASAAPSNVSYELVLARCEACIWNTIDIHIAVQLRIEFVDGVAGIVSGVVLAVVA